MLLYASTIVFLLRGNVCNEYFAGLALGLWLFKPHFALIALALLAVAGVWRAVLAALIPAAVFYGSAALAFGVLWPLSYLDAVQAFVKHEASTNKLQIVSLFTMGDTLGGILGGNAAVILRVLFLLAALAVLLISIALFWGVRRAVSVEARNAALERALYALGPTIVMLSPHTMFYDLGLCLVPLYFLWQKPGDRSYLTAIEFILLSALVTTFRDTISFLPMILLPVTTFVLACRNVGNNGGGSITSDTLSDSEA